MSTNLDSLRRGFRPLAMAMVLAATAGTSDAAAQHSRGSARPPSSSGGGSHSVSRPPSSGGHSSTPSRAPSSGSSSYRGPSGSGRQVIENDSRHHRYTGSGYNHGYGGYYGGGYYPYYPYYPYWGYGYGYWGSPWYWGWGGYGYPYYGASVYYGSGGYGYGGYGGGGYGDMGALDCDLSPEHAEVYVNGQRMGVADDFDGFPTFLWLEKGTYDVVFYMPGFRTLARQYTIYPGAVIDVNDRMEVGDAVMPEDLQTKTHERRDARVQEDQEREREYYQQAPPPGDEHWRERPGETMAPPSHDDAQPRDVRGQPGTLILKVEPDDASVYLDGRFIGTGGELSRLRSGLIVETGPHRLEVVRPGRQSETQSFGAEAGEEVEVSIELEEQ